MDLLKSSLCEISNAIQTKKLSAQEVTQFFLSRIERLNPKLNAYILINELALKEAQEIDQRLARGESLGSLAGVPFGIKDMFCTKGIRTTAASKMLLNFVPPYDATAVAKLKNQGAILLGKLNQDEFAMGSSNESSYFGPVRNPWNLERVPGGSSGGSAAAQAARLCAATLGTDTGGSIRQPASFCGVVGIKPTYGRVSRYGIIAYASSLDQAGPIVSTVEDAAVVLTAICGQDPMDQTTSNKSVPDFKKGLNKSIKGLRVGILKEYESKDGLDSEVQETFLAAQKDLEKMGAELVPISVPLTSKAVAMYYLIASAEASSNLARYDGVKYGHRAEFESLGGVTLEEFYMKTRGEGFGAEVKRRIMLGTYGLSAGYYDAFYNKACRVRRLLRDQYVEAFQKCDCILSPVTTTPAFKIGERVEKTLAMYLNDIFTVSTNLAGLPGLSVPYRVSRLGLPIGVQLTGQHFDEQQILNVALALEESSGLEWRVAHA